MEHMIISEPTGFSQLSKAEQIRYLQALWDRIAERPDEIPVPESHIRLAEQRLAEYRRDPSRGRPAHDVFDRLQKKDR
ncbi:Putative addiction module component [Candidatus Methylomirabilis lanthanidiphila]|uniref:Addiction module component n=1 Tax=Candidatus Methylomirabilis lanthanidiphila TaxID=2211376 RepID=A0A564ZEX3_9BACT|nr:addiction module protein [Candidatus Methylomirabilis lanthanidiphila]VUZ83879.1 Putative addiction module component [Candidatus Methylomirabilis lanthanidiphila]